MGNDGSDLDSFLKDIEVKKEKEEYERNSLADKLNVMLVDDDDTVQRTLSPVIPYKVNYANNANKALEMIDESTAVAILDILMPGMDGIALAEKIHGRHPDTVLIVYTAYPGQYQTSEILDFRHGLSSFVTKPDTERLIEQVKIGFNKYAGLQAKRFFSPDITPKEREIILGLCADLTKGTLARKEEDHEIAGPAEAKRYCEGVTYPENADNILVPYEIDMLFGIKGKNIASLCSGPGGLSMAMAKYDAKKVVGIDGSEYMINFAKSTFQRKNLEYVHSNIFELNGDCYDIVVCQNSLHHFHPNERVREFMEVAVGMLKPGGKFYGMDYRRDNLNIVPLIRRLEETNKNVRMDLAYTFLASLSTNDLDDVFKSFNDKIDYKVSFPDKSGLFDKIKQWDRYKEAVKADPHPHYLDYQLSWRLEITKK